MRGSSENEETLKPIYLALFVVLAGHWMDLDAIATGPGHCGKSFRIG